MTSYVSLDMIGYELLKHPWMSTTYFLSLVRRDLQVDSPVQSRLSRYLLSFTQVTF